MSFGHAKNQQQPTKWWKNITENHEFRSDFAKPRRKQLLKPVHDGHDQSHLLLHDSDKKKGDKVVLSLETHQKFIY
jgi:hypothetical protein